MHFLQNENLQNKTSKILAGARGGGWVHDAAGGAVVASAARRREAERDAAVPGDDVALPLLLQHLLLRPLHHVGCEYRCRNVTLYASSTVP